MAKVGTASRASLEAENAGYSHALSRRQLEMIAIGGAIGTGLFLAVGGRLASAGPILVLLYAIAGFFAFLVVRALAELVLHRPASGSFVSYARELIGERTAFVVGWMYVLASAAAGIADVTAVAIYARYWGAFQGIPQWIVALLALVIVLAVNLTSVRFFGFAEYWAAMIKVAALVAFLAIGVFVLGTGRAVEGTEPGVGLIADNGGLLPNGFGPALIVLPGVVFAYASLEVFSIAAGETKDAAKIIPRAANAILWRIGLFYIGSVLLMTLLLPYTAYSATESPFVTVLSGLGIQGAGSVMNFVVLTAALSAVNSGVYATARILRTMAVAGTAPPFTVRMSSRHVPIGGIAFISIFYALGILLNAVLPAKAFALALDVGAVGILTTWSCIMWASLNFWRLSRSGAVQRPRFAMPWAPYSQVIGMVFFGFVFVTMWFDEGVGDLTLIAMAPVLIALAIGWASVRRRVARRDQETAGEAAGQA